MGFSQEQWRKSNCQEDWILEGQENVILLYFISGGPCQLWSLYNNCINIVNITIVSYIFFLQTLHIAPVKVWLKNKTKKNSSFLQNCKTCFNCKRGKNQNKYKNSCQFLAHSEHSHTAIQKEAACVQHTVLMLQYSEKIPIKPTVCYKITVQLWIRTLVCSTI